MKKEAYFHLGHISDQARLMRLELENQVELRTFQEPFCHRTALLILDMQQVFFDPDSHAYIPSAPAIIPGLNHLINRWNGPVIYTQHSNDPTNAHSMAKWWKTLIHPNSKQFALIDEWESQKGIRIEKHQYDAFMNTNLEKVLREKEIHSLVIGGVMTHLCCESTARSGFMRGWNIIVLVDGCATYNRPFHMASLLTLAHGFAHVMTVEEVVDRLDQSEC